MAKSIFKSLPSLIIDNNFLTAGLIPPYGLKTISLLGRKTGRDFLFQTQDKITKDIYGGL